MLDTRREYKQWQQLQREVLLSCKVGITIL